MKLDIVNKVEDRFAVDETAVSPGGWCCCSIN